MEVTFETYSLGTDTTTNTDPSIAIKNEKDVQVYIFIKLMVLPLSYNSVPIFLKKFPFAPKLY